MAKFEDCLGDVGAERAEKGGISVVVTVAGIEPAALRSGDVRSIH
jgi:hypothetical protein